MQSQQPFHELFPGLAVLDVVVQPDVTIVTARAVQTTAVCPRCQMRSTHVHSYYTRKPQDLPILGSTVRLLLHVRRWRCLSPACSARTFSEPLPELLAPRAQRTNRLSLTLQQLALALGGEAGARQSQRQGMSTSPATLLRLTRRIPVPDCPTPRIVAVDDFACRKGRRYGTLLVNGEDHRPLDLLPERSATALSRWLREHPGIEIITRDRATEYARGATDGAPHALQVLDRWHLIGNLQEALVRLLDRLRSRLHHLVTASTVNASTNDGLPTISIYDREPRRGTKDQVRQQQGRARRYARYAEVKALHRRGFKILQIARKLDISRQTVRTYIASEQFPERGPKPRQSSILDPHVAYLQERWDQGVRTNTQLYAELVDRGFRGSMRPLVQWTMLRREREAGGPRAGRTPARQVEVFVAPDTTPKPRSGNPKLPGPQSLAWFLLANEGTLEEAKREILRALKQDGDVFTAWDLAQQFLTMIRNRQREKLAPWLEACLGSGIGELVTFAVGLQREAVNVRAAVELPYNNGVAEGNVTRLKQIRRAMYGRGNFDLLRIRVLAAA